MKCRLLFVSFFVLSEMIFSQSLTDSLYLTVDASQIVKAPNKNVMGIAFHRVSGYTLRPYDWPGEYKLNTATEEAIKDLRLPLTRFYGLANERYSLNEALDKVAFLCTRLNIPQKNVILEFECERDSVRMISAEKWVEGLDYCKKQGYQFEYFEIVNEPWNPERFASPKQYTDHFLEVSKAVKAKYPELKLGIAVCRNDFKLWTDTVLANAKGYYDFVTPHWYSFTAYTDDFEETVLAENQKVIENIRAVNSLIKRYNGDKNVIQMDTEWGLHCGVPNAGKDYRNGNIFGTLYRAVRMIYYLREDLLKGATSWSMFTYYGDPGFSILVPDKPEKGMMYWLYYYFSRYVGSGLPHIVSSGLPEYKTKYLTVNKIVDLCPTIITTSEDSKELYIISANGSWAKDIPCTIKTSKFTFNSVEGTFLSSDDKAAHPVVKNKSDFVKSLTVDITKDGIKYVLPKHSVAFLKLSNSATPVKKPDMGKASFKLNQNYPNPFNPLTAITYQIPESGFVTLKVYDTLGKEIAVLANGNREEGTYSAEFDGSNLSSGIYFYQLHAGEFVSTKKMTLIK